MNKNLLNSIQVKKPKRNHFNMTHDVKLSLKMGGLYPIMVQECVPGDTVNIATESLLRFAPLVAPVMHRVNVYMHYFFCPNRNIMPQWDAYIAGEDDTMPHPYMEYDQADYDAFPLLDYMGLPRPNVADVPVRFNPLPLAAYQKIYNEYYRDQNLIPEVAAEVSPGMNSFASGIGVLRQRAWEHDYFTSALPWAQFGTPVEIPIGKVKPSPVYLNDDETINAAVSVDATNVPSGTSTSFTVPRNELDPLDNPDIPLGRLYAAEQDVAPTTINDLRRAFRLQEWLEKMARGGRRLKEIIKMHFGVDTKDARLQRPEYITGSKSPVVISEIVNTTGEVDGLPQGNMAGHGMSVTSGRQGSYYCEEHGYIIGIMSVIPITAYSQGIPRHYLKNDRLDYYWPDFAHLGEQELLNKELYVDHVEPDGVFGYVPRYTEYKYNPSRVAGDFKTTLDYWHLGRDFSTSPTLTKAFIECFPSTRIFAVEDGTDYLYAHVLNKLHMIRPMPKFGTPSF